MTRTKWFALSAIPFVIAISACSSGDSASKNSAASSTVASTINIGLATTTTTVAAESTTTTTVATSSSSATANWEIVVGIYPTKAEAQTQVDKLTKAGFTGFTIKPLKSTFAVVKTGFTNADAAALMKQINDSGAGTATLYQLIDPTATNFEVVAGIYPTEAEAHTQIDKLTKAGLTGFTVKPIPNEFAVVKAGLTSAEATALVTKVDTAGLGPSRVKQL